MVVVWSVVVAIAQGAAPDSKSCRVFGQGAVVELHSPFFVYRLRTEDGLRAASWENRITGRTLNLGNGAEVEFDIGLPDLPLKTPKLRVTRSPTAGEGATGEALFELASDDPKASVTVTYRWDAKRPVLQKLVKITNASGQEWNRLLNVRVGSYAVTNRAHAPSGDERGFPVYIDDETFMTLAHPAGLAEAKDAKVVLRQFPGARVGPGQTFDCMEAIYGVGTIGGARKAFLDHLTGRMRRTVRGHDRPYAIFEPFGARQGGVFYETEAFVLDSMATVARGQQDAGCHFDLYSVDFWVDYRGTLKECDPERFPNGLKRIREELDKLGTSLGLWIDSSWERWSIGGNPKVQSCLNVDTHRPQTHREVSWGRKSFCRATEPIKSMYTDAFRHHIRENGVRLLKFDNLASGCVNPNHDHLPGLYSTEPVYDAVIDFLHALDQECPDVFLMLYWGYRSPWWLLHGDTLFDSGIGIEAASPSTLPAPHARDSVTQKLDQAQWHASDVPALGKDSLGIWLSDWGWNSSIGKERWQAGLVMDLCRGSLLAQPWSDTPWLSPPERRQMAEFIALLKARPECFRNPRFIVGDPRRDEPYGYCCSDGTRAFVALHNCSWNDNVITLRPNPDWGLPLGRRWDVYRWYPDPAKLVGGEEAFHETAAIGLRPFDVVLLEVVPSGQPATLNRAFETRPMPVTFAVASRSVDVDVHYVHDEPSAPETLGWTILKPVRAVSAGGAKLTTQKDESILASGDTSSPDTYTITADTSTMGVTGIRLEALPDGSLPCRGPGRAVNGNFCLTEIRVRAFPRGRPDEAIAIRLQNPAADFSQDSYGGWPVSAALDGNPKTGWSVDPEEGRRHVAVFETQKPIGSDGSTTLVVELDQGDRQHSLGRFRLSVTGAKPVPKPRRREPPRLVVRGRLPAASQGGLVVVTVEMSRNGEPTELRNAGQLFSAKGSLDSRPATWQPVLGKATYPSCWQAWRLQIEPSTQSREMALTLVPRVSRDVDLRCKGRLVAH